MKNILKFTYFFVLLISVQDLYSQDFKKMKKEELINYINNKNSDIDSLNGKLIELEIQRDRLDRELKNLQINLIDSRNTYETQLKELDFDLSLRLNAISRLEKSNRALTDSLKNISSYVLDSRDFKKPQVGGTYSIGCGEAGGILKIYPVSKDVLLFALDITNGPPSYNLGLLQGKMTLKGNVGHYKEEGCEFKFLFGTFWVIVDEVQVECPFGAGVRARGVYSKINSEIPNTYWSGVEELYFKNLLEDLGL